jgi:hypothetical protein
MAYAKRLLSPSWDWLLDRGFMDPWSDCEVRPEAGAEMRPATGNALSRCTQKPDIPPGV